MNFHYTRFWLTHFSRLVNCCDFGLASHHSGMTSSSLVHTWWASLTLTLFYFTHTLFSLVFYHNTSTHTHSLSLSFVFVRVEIEESLSLYVYTVLSPNLFLLDLDIFSYNNTTQLIVVFYTNSIHPLTHYSRSSTLLHKSHYSYLD